MYQGLFFMEETGYSEMHKNRRVACFIYLTKGAHICSQGGASFNCINFVVAMNPCPCGYYPDMNRCRCTPPQVMRYMGKISQPLLDRLDLCAEVSPVDFEGLSNGHAGESTEKIRQRVICAQDIQRERYKIEGIQFNGELKGSQIEKYCLLEKDARKLLKMAFQHMPFSARAYHRILKVARTIADMEAAESIHRTHVAEALSYRAFDKKYWN